MKIGSKSLLYGVHQVFIHPLFVAVAWWMLYGFPYDPRLWVAFIVHDWGYFGKPNMDGPEGEQHPILGATILGWLFGDKWFYFCLYHSRFLAKRDGYQYSKLCAADKLAIGLTPPWLYLPLAKASGELKEYMEGKGARTPAGTRTAIVWYRDVQKYCIAWAYEHKDLKEDIWTGTKRDLALDNDNTCEAVIIISKTVYKPCYCLSCQNQWFESADDIVPETMVVCPRCGLTDTNISKGANKK